MVSVCLLTIDRYWITRYTIENLLKNSGGVELELLVLDNGSTDKRIIPYIQQLIETKKYSNLITVGIIEEEVNIGVAKGFNKLFKEAKGNYICTVGNDILVDVNWVLDLVYYNSMVQKSGLTSIYCLLDKGKYRPLLTNDDGFLNVWQNDNNLVYGVTLFNKELLNVAGYFDERLGFYGCEDSQYAWRLSMLGYHNYYIPGQSSIHIGNDIGDESEYRKNKNNNLKISELKLAESINDMKKTKKYFIDNA
jgi:GT2 family glycosyltransferase